MSEIPKPKICQHVTSMMQPHSVTASHRRNITVWASYSPRFAILYSMHWILSQKWAALHRNEDTSDNQQRTEIVSCQWEICFHRIATPSLTS